MRIIQKTSLEHPEAASQQLCQSFFHYIHDLIALQPVFLADLDEYQQLFDALPVEDFSQQLPPHLSDWLHHLAGFRQAPALRNQLLHCAQPLLPRQVALVLQHYQQDLHLLLLLPHLLLRLEGSARPGSLKKGIRVAFGLFGWPEANGQLAQGVYMQRSVLLLQLKEKASHTVKGLLGLSREEIAVKDQRSYGFAVRKNLDVQSFTVFYPVNSYLQVLILLNDDQMFIGGVDGLFLSGIAGQEHGQQRDFLQQFSFYASPALRHLRVHLLRSQGPHHILYSRSFVRVQPYHVLNEASEPPAFYTADRLPQLKDANLLTAILRKHLQQQESEAQHIKLLVGHWGSGSGRWVALPSLGLFDEVEGRDVELEGAAGEVDSIGCDSAVRNAGLVHFQHCQARLFEQLDNGLLGMVEPAAPDELAQTLPPLHPRIGDADAHFLPLGAAIARYLGQGFVIQTQVGAQLPQDLLFLLGEHVGQLVRGRGLERVWEQRGSDRNHHTWRQLILIWRCADQEGVSA